MSPTEPVTGWREPILRHFPQELAAVARVTLVADPDRLMTEMQILDALRRRGYEVLTWEDAVSFRYVYESRYRNRWASGQGAALVVVPGAGSADLESLPFDLLEQARFHRRCLHFGLTDLFPDLDPTILGELDHACLDALHQARSRHQHTRLGANATSDFVLRHVFQVDPQAIREPEHLLRLLLRRHYRRQRYPEALDRRLVEVLSQDPAWRGWPLEAIVPDREAFLAFLQERWPLYLLDTLTPRPEPSAVCESELEYSGPRLLPFGHDDIRVYIDNLFLEGHLAPMDVVPRAAVRGTWMSVGVGTEQEGAAASERFARLFEKLDQEVPGEDATPSDWTGFAAAWGESIALRWTMLEEELPVAASRCEELHDRLEATFATWMQRHYGSLHNLSFVQRPVMLHHVPHHLARRLDARGKLALLVVDGLALDQWSVLRRSIEDRVGAARLEEDAAFAWVPTLTGVSRQALFAGEPPMFFASSLGRTQQDERHWQRFWEERGINSSGTGWLGQKKQEPDDLFLTRVAAALEHPKLRILGLVVSTVDESMHGLVTGTRGLHGLLREWARSGHLARLIDTLLAAGFEVCLTSDHGNIEARGMGKPKVGAVADERGERVHVFPDEGLRRQVHGEFPETCPWPPIGLPQGFHPLLASGRKAFLSEGKWTVAHGGIAMEEVIVPFVRIRRPS